MVVFVLFIECRQRTWRRRGRCEVTYLWGTVESGSIGSIRTVVVKLVTCFTWEFSSTSCKCFLSTYLLSHPGYFGKKGIKRFHVRKNRDYAPVVNLDKLWTLVSENTLKAAKENKDKATVIDVSKAVILILSHSSRASSRYSERVNSPRSPSSWRQRCSPKKQKRGSRPSVEPAC